MAGFLFTKVCMHKKYLSYIVNVLSRYCYDYDRSHWNAALRVLRYLKHTYNNGILYARQLTGMTLNAYSDVDFAGDIDTRKSTSGCLITLSAGPIIWFSRKKSTISLSTAKAEYIAASLTGREITWLRMFLSEISYQCKSAIPLNVDNKAAIQLAEYPKAVRNTKHIDIKYHSLREKVSLTYVENKQQLADIFT